MTVAGVALSAPQPGLRPASDMVSVGPAQIVTIHWLGSPLEIADILQETIIAIVVLFFYSFISA